MSDDGRETVEIGSLCEAIFDGPHATPPKTDSGAIFLGISNLSNGRLDLAQTEHLSDEDFTHWTRRVTPEADDVVFSYETRLGEAAIIPKGLRCCLGRRMALMRPNRAKVKPRFLLYAFLGPEFQETLYRRTIPGSTVDRIPLIEFPSFSIRVPALREQRAIARILGTLDDKIELNRRMNETLEAMARAIFKSWFVDFDPVRAKAEGRQPSCMDAATAALFPDSFQGSPLGKIPRGWAIRRLGEVAGVNERTLTGDYPHKTIQYVEISSVAAGKLLASTKYELSEAPSRAKRLVSHGDTIWSCVRPNRKAYLFVHNPAPNLAVSTGFAVLTPKQIVPTYLYAWVTTDDFVEYLSYSADGSAYPAVRPDRFSDSQILIPSSAELERFEQIAGPMRDKIAQNDNEARALAAIRDTLLPKLISGEIRVKEAEKFVEKAL